MMCSTTRYTMKSLRRLSAQSNLCTSSSNSKKPVLTLYTKDNCSLCEDAKEVIFEAFPDQFTLKEVDITAPENKHWYRAYRYDIPVFHYEGQYLMKHRANIDLLGKKLKEFNPENILEELTSQDQRTSREYKVYRWDIPVFHCEGHAVSEEEQLTLTSQLGEGSQNSAQR